MSFARSLLPIFFCIIEVLPLANVCIDVNDILSPNWMPGTILEKAGKADNIAYNRRQDTNNGSINSALHTMTFHRSMLNQYQCRNYVANQIALEMAKRTFKRRTSEMENDISETPDKETSKKDINNRLMDQGSAAYEEWLKKSSTLEDIYSHHNLAEEKATKSSKFDPDYHGIPDYIATDNGHQIYEQPFIVHQTSEIEKTDTKGEKLADIFEIALTALAYLSFGMFIVHLIMSISAVSNSETNTIYPRIVGLNLGINAEESRESEEEKFRSVKDVSPSNPNRLAKSVLAIYDSALIAEDDEGQCLQNALCAATKHSRFVKGKSKLFMILWSFGASWLSENLSNKTISKTQGLQAVILGLGKADCDDFYLCQKFKT